MEEIENEEEDEEKRKRMKKEIKLFKYIGETSRSIYERGLEHIRDFRELKKESHMIKHYFDQHEEEELDEMEFGMKISRTTKSAFNRQILESVEIQAQRSRHYLLNSRSEYNRCALPRLTARLGDDVYDKVDKEKKEEKHEEYELEKKIRDLKIKLGKSRREDVGKREQPPEKKRKIGVEEYKRVMQSEKHPEKRKNDQDVEERRQVYKIFENNTNNKKKKVEIEDEEDEKCKKKESKEDPIETIDWEECLEDKERKMEEEEKERKSREEQMISMEKSYELLNLCRKTLEEEGETWIKSKERRDMERVVEEERKERLTRAGVKREETLKKLKRKETQTKITDKLKEIPENRRKMIEMQVEKERRAELKEAKEKLISRWRQNKGKKDTLPKLKDDQEDLEIKLKRRKEN